MQWQKLRILQQAVTCNHFQSIRLFLENQTCKRFQLQSSKIIYVFFCRPENDDNEMKMIFGGDPVKKIMDEYIGRYTCGFFNSHSQGTILFGIQEVEKLFHIVGMVIPLEERKELVRKVAYKLSTFYPPVSTSRYRLIFHNVFVHPNDIIKDQQFGSADKSTGKNAIILKCSSTPDKIGYDKWPNFVKGNLPGCLSRVIPLKKNYFCIVVDDPKTIPDDFGSRLDKWVDKNPQVSKDTLPLQKLTLLLKQLCIVELKLNRTPYPIHMVKPVETRVFRKNGDLNTVNYEDIMSLTRKYDSNNSPSQFQVDQFLEHTSNFDLSGRRNVLIASPVMLEEHERYIAGIVIPQWTLVIDLDQQPNQIGHLFYHFDELHNIHQPERKRVLKTPKERNLGLDPDHVTCWLAALGHDRFTKSLSEKSKFLYRYCLFRQSGV